MKLVIVESPTKAAKIQEYLGGAFAVLASGGHFRDLPDTELGVDLNTFAANYVVMPKKVGQLKRLRAAMAKADEVLLATDPDREGEAIAWHLMQELQPKRFKRVKFQEITPKAVQHALKHAGHLDGALVDAQQTRRILDRIVGFKVSELLFALGTNNSAGRVQSAALHLVVEREKAREQFIPEDYWTLTASYGNGLKARYASIDKDGNIAETRLKSEAEAAAVVAGAQGAHVVRGLNKEPVERRPPPPFTTSKLQQRAGRKLKFSIDKTMELAQKLFENGHITYHRTDAVNLSDEAVEMARAFIAKDYPEGLPDSPNLFRGKASAQEAHEAIRPTSLEVAIPDGLSIDEAALYVLIRTQFLACQSKPAQVEQTTVVVESGKTVWRARGNVLRFKGWKKYVEEDEVATPAEPSLPQLELNATLELKGVGVEAKQTQPPPRFTLLSLADEMEKVNIGRPSTVPKIAGEEGVLLKREYVLQDEKKFIRPSQRGRVVDLLLEKAFGPLVEVDYTADLEQRLDDIAEGKLPYKTELTSWWQTFGALLEKAPDIVGAELAAHPEWESFLPQKPKPTDKSCPRCQSVLNLRNGKNGAFLSCSGYPKCTYTVSPSVAPSAAPCPLCGMAMEEVDGKFGRYARCVGGECKGRRDLSPMCNEKCPLCESPMKNKGEFLSCSRYPECKGTRPSATAKGPTRRARPTKAGPPCPQCGKEMRERKSARGVFWGCSAFPECKGTLAAKAGTP